MKEAPKQLTSLEGARAAAPIECVWMVAGVVAYKLCDREFDCDRCPFDLAIRAGAHSQSPAECGKPEGRASSEVEGYEVADHLFYHPSHVWARVEDQGRVRVGLDDFGQKLAGRIYSVWLPEVGTSINRGEPCWRITHRAGESVVTAPVTGTLEQVNARLAEQPSLVNSGPYAGGWVMVIQPTRLEECLRNLFYGDRAKQMFERDAEDLHRRFDQLITDAAAGQTMQDGGARVPNFMSLLAADKMRQLIDSFLSVPATCRARRQG